MRKHLLLSLTLILVLAAATSALAKDSGAKYKRMHGDIESVDATAQTFTVKHDKESSTFKTDSSTKFLSLGKTITLADLKVGDDVRVSFTENGSDKTAARVDVKPEHEHHPKP
ncbi:MAG TPA: DUF5666 domain-containing protein [Thermoanaerobaculia bacterium]|nr:DUF5666 domain-containing protein [Thermoanaerobaculia bacterium]